MGLHELTPFIREAVTHVHDVAVLQQAWLAAGSYGEDNPLCQRFRQLAKTDADREALAEIIFLAASNAIITASWFVEERITMKHLAVTVSDGSKPYQIEDTDMFHSYFSGLCHEYSQVSAKAVLEEINSIEAGGKKRPYPEYTEFPRLRPAE